MNAIRILSLAAVLAGAGCSWFGGEDYKQSTALPPLEVPPGLSTPPRDDRLAVPELPAGRVSAVQTARQGQGGATPIARQRETDLARREPRPLDNADPSFEPSFEDEGPEDPGVSSGALAGAQGGLQTIEGVPVLVVAEPFGEVWQRTAAALERIGLVVENQDQTQGVYRVRYEGPANAEPGPLGELFDDANGLTPGSRYSVYLLEQGTQTLITAHAESPLPETAAADVLRLITAALQDAGGPTG